MSASYEAFVQQCQRDGLNLHENLVDSPFYDGAETYQPDEWYGAVAVAGNLLRKHPGRPLAGAVLPEGSMPPTNNTVASDSLRAIINASLEPVDKLDASVEIVCGRACGMDNCRYAESSFASTIDALRTPDEYLETADKSPIGWTVIADDGAPVGITKTLGQGSTLSLSTFVVNGIPYPAGSLFRADTVDTVRLKSDEHLVVPARSLGSVAFLRLSAFALPDDERRVFVDGLEDAAKDRLLQPAMHVEEIKDAARHAIQYITAGSE